VTSTLILVTQESPEDGHLYEPKHVVIERVRKYIHLVNCCERRFYLYVGSKRNRMHDPIIKIIDVSLLDLR
jgi:hypothetical protein